MVRIREKQKKELRVIAMNYAEESLKKHRQWKGKVSYQSKAPLNNKDDLAVAYTPGVAAPSLEIARNPEAVNELTGKGNLIAVVSDGSAVLGLGNVGPLAALPVMEGKAVLFKELGDVDAVPVVLDTQDPDEIVAVVKAIAPNYAGINLEDIKAPQCFEIERKLKEKLDIPVFHDDQHGTACVLLAALTNATKLAGKDKDSKIVISGAGAAGSAIADLLMKAGYKNILMSDIHGILTEENALSDAQKELAKKTNPQKKEGALKDALKGADVFIGVSRGNLVDEEMVASMNEKPIVFAMANPEPEILPDKAKNAGAFITASGRSDFPNQINNVLIFPGLFRGLLDAQAREVSDEIKLAAAQALADLIDEKDLSQDYIIVDALDPRAAKAVAKAVKEQALREKADGQ